MPPLDRETDLATAPPGADDDGRAHVQKYGYPDDKAPEMVVMFCGLVLGFDDLLRPIPEGHDFYLSKHGHKATCRRCLAAWRARA